MSIESKIGAEVEDFTTIGVSRERVKKLKEIRDEEEHRNLDTTIALAISAYEQITGFEQFAQKTGK